MVLFPSASQCEEKLQQRADAETSNAAAWTELRKKWTDLELDFGSHAAKTWESEMAAEYGVSYKDRGPLGPSEGGPET